MCYIRDVSGSRLYHPAFVFLPIIRYFGFLPHGDLDFIPRINFTALYKTSAGAFLNSACLLILKNMGLHNLQYFAPGFSISPVLHIVHLTISICPPIMILPDSILCNTSLYVPAILPVSKMLPCIHHIQSFDPLKSSFKDSIPAIVSDVFLALPGSVVCNGHPIGTPLSILKSLMSCMVCFSGIP